MSRAKKNWIQGANIKKGALHRQLRIPMGQKIPKLRLKKAERSRNPLLRERAQLADTLGHLRKK